MIIENETIVRLVDEIPLDISIYVTVNMSLNDFIHTLGVRKEGHWTNSKHDKYLSKEINKAAIELTNRILEEIKNKKIG